MQGVLLVLVAVVGGGEFDANTAYPELSGKVAQVKPAPLGSDALTKQRARLDASLRSAVRPAGAKAMPKNKRANPIRVVGYDEQPESNGVQPAQFEQNLRYPRRGVDGSVYGQGRTAAKDPTAGTGQKLQPVPPKSGYGSTPRKQSPFLPDPNDAYAAKANSGMDSIYADEKDQVDLSGYEPLSSGGSESAAARKTPGYRPPTRKTGGSNDKQAAPDLSLMFPEEDDSEFKGYEISETPDPAPKRTLTLTPPASKSPASIYDKPLPVRSETPAYEYGKGLPEAKPVGHGAPADPYATTRPPADPYAATTPRVPHTPAPTNPNLPVNSQQPASSNGGTITTQFPQKPVTPVNQPTTPQYSYPPQKPQYGQPNTPVQPRAGQVTQPKQHVAPTRDLPQFPAPRQVADSTRRAMQSGRDNLNRIFENPIPTVTPVPGNDNYGTGNELQRAETRFEMGGSYLMTLIALFASMGLNFYLGWHAFDTYNRYQDLVADMNYNGARRERRDRRLAEGSY